MPAPVRPLPTPRDAAAVARQFGVADPEARAVAQGFSGACVFRVEGGGQTVAVRFWPSGTDARRIAALHGFIGYVAPSASPFVCRPIAVSPTADSRGGDQVSIEERDVSRRPWNPNLAGTGRDSRSAVEFASSFASDCSGTSRVGVTGAAFYTFIYHDERLAQAEPWLSGSPVTPGRLPPDVIVEVPRLLAALQQRAATYVADGCPWFGARHGVSPSLRHRIEAAESLDCDPPPVVDDIDRMAMCRLKSLRKRLIPAGEHAMPLQPCLRDLWSDSVLTDGERVTGLIDLNGARSDHPAADAARLFGSLAGDDRAVRERLVTEYTRHTKLERGLFDLYDEAGVTLSLLLWRRKLGRREADGDDPRVARRLVALRQQLAALDSPVW